MSRRYIIKQNKILNVTKDIIILDDVKVADTFFTRLKGLMGKKNLFNGEGILIKPCNSIHTIGMKFSIDVVFVDKDNKVIHIIEDMQKRKVSPIIKKSKYVVEAMSGTFENKVNIGDKLKFN